MSTKTISKQDIDRLYGIASSNSRNLEKALDGLERMLREQTALSSFTEIPSAFQEPRFMKLFEEDLLAQLLSRLRITEYQWKDILRLSQKWADICDAKIATQPLVHGLVEYLAKFLNCEIRSYPHHEGDVWDFSLHFPDIHLNFFDEDVHMIVVTNSNAGPNEFRRIKELIRHNNAMMKVTMLLVVGDGVELRELAKAAEVEIVVLDENDCKSIVMSHDSRQMFCHRVARRVSVQALQPYQTQGKVRSRMFYGRQTELRRLKSNLSSSFAIYGGRLVGKSSLLHKIGTEFRNDSSQHYQVCSITAQGIRDPVEVCRVILKKLDIPTASHKSILTFERLIRDRLNSSSRNMLILIDEVDDLIAIDERGDYQVFETFHNLNNDFGERCRFVFAGYRDLAIHLMDSVSRFRNFAEPIKLGNLDPINARRLIEEPMCDELGFTFDSDELIDRTLEITSGHPNYIQVFCKNLSEDMDSRKARRIRETDIQRAFHNADFRSRVVETFYVNFSPLQQMLVALAILDEKDGFTTAEASASLKKVDLDVDISDVYSELRQLEMSFILEKDGTNYRFVHKLFPEMLKSSEDLEMLVITLLETREMV